MKLFKRKFGCEPTNTPIKTTSAKAAAISKDADSEVSDNYDDDEMEEDDDDWDFGEAKDKKPAAPGKSAKKSSDDDEYDVDDLLGELESGSKPKPASATWLDQDSSAKKGIGGLGDLDDLEGDLDDLTSGLPQKSDDKFNQVLSSSKEAGGLLAQIGLKKEDMKDDDSLIEDDDDDDKDSLGDLHKKSDLFDRSKDRGGQATKKRHAFSDEDDDDDDSDDDLDFKDSSKKE